MKYTSAIIASAGGSIGGATASHNRYGLYFRTRTIPVNTNTTFQQEVRNTFALYASRWTSVLTQAQRDGWDTYALNTGQTTGLNAYVASQTARVQAGLATVDAPPTTFSAATFTPIALVITTPDTLNYTFTNSDAWATAVGGALIIAVSRPFSPSINFFKGPYRFATAKAGAATPPTSPSTGTAPFTFTPGQKAGIHVRAVLADGRISSVQRFTTIAEAP